MSFKDIKGQDSAIQFLKRTLEKNRFSHAYIFLGPRGVGRKLTALNFAKALNCYGEAQERPCDRCASCKKINSFNHPDVLCLKPEKDGASLGIDEIRALIKDIGFKPYEGRTKVYIIDDAHAMKHEAQNALLKTLEEPPPAVILILIVESLKRLFPTIISRSQVIRFYSLKIDEVRDILMKGYNVDEVKAHILSHLASGRLGEGLRFLKDSKPFFDKRGALIKNLMDKTFFESDFENVPIEETRFYLDVILSWYRDILITKSGVAEPSMLINVDRLDAILDEAKKLEFDHLDGILNQAVSTEQYLSRNANPKLAMSVLAMKIDGI